MWGDILWGRTVFKTAVKLRAYVSGVGTCAPLLKDDLNGILDTLNEECVWDGIAIQEGLKGHPQGTFRIKNSWVIVGPSRGRGGSYAASRTSSWFTP